MSTLETRPTKLPPLLCSDTSPELEILKHKAISGTSHTKEELNGLVEQKLYEPIPSSNLLAKIDMMTKIVKFSKSWIKGIIII